MPDLYLHDPDFDPAHEKQKATGMFGIAEKPLPIEDWEDLAATVRKQSPIRQLVFSFHGFDGGMMVGGDGRQLGEASVKALFGPAGGKTPKAGTIRFIGCNIGNRPTQMAAFAAMLGAGQVSGYTWYMVNQAVGIDFPKGSDEATIRKTLEPFQPYAVGMLPSAKVLATTVTRHRAHKVEFVAYYGSTDGSAATTLPIPFGQGKTRKPWTAAARTAIKARDAAQTEKEIQSAPVTPFQLVTVSL